MDASQRQDCKRRGHVGRSARHWVDTQKKTPVARERDRPEVLAKRRSFLKNQPNLDVERLIFLDESGFRLGSSPHYGWAPIGEKSPGKSVQGAWKTKTMIGALGLSGFKGFMTIDDATSGEVFRAFVRHELQPRLRPGDLVVMDNLNAHKNAEVVRMIREAGADVLYLPPYSPEYNPIEKAWAKMKELLRRVETLTREAFDNAVATAMDAVSRTDIIAWFNYAGYQI